MPVDQRDPTPLWMQLSAILRAGIEDGTWTEMLPSETRLMQEHGVSRGTVRRAIEDLGDLVIVIQGRGIFIR